MGFWKWPRFKDNLTHPHPSREGILKMATVLKIVGHPLFASAERACPDRRSGGPGG